jgi:hypothetical protein
VCIFIFICFCSIFEALTLVYRHTTCYTNTRSLTPAFRILGQTVETGFSAAQARKAGGDNEGLDRSCSRESIELWLWDRSEHPPPPRRCVPLTRKFHVVSIKHQLHEPSPRGRLVQLRIPSRFLSQPNLHVKSHHFCFRHPIHNSRTQKRWRASCNNTPPTLMRTDSLSTSSSNRICCRYSSARTAHLLS